MSLNNNLNAALRLADCGIRTFPAKPVLKGNGNWNKPPYITGWQSNATTDRDQIRGWWADWPDAIPGLPYNGFIVIDADRHIGGADGVGKPRSETARALMMQWLPGPTAHR